GSTNVARIRHVSEQVFLDEDEQRFQFTWRTIQTWYSRYKKDGTTTVLPKPRSDKGKTRKVTPEEVLGAIEQVPELPRTAQRDGLLSRLHRARPAPARAHRSKHLPSRGQGPRATQARRRGPEQAPPRLRQGPRQRAVAGRHHVWPLRLPRRR